MTPLEKAAELVAIEQQPACLPCWHAKPGIRCGCVNDARAIITAFLEEAAEDERTAERAGMAALLNGPYLNDAGQAAILALKETLG